LTSAAKLSETHLKLKYFDQFRVSYRKPSGEPYLTQRVYRTCQIGNIWRCMTLEGNRLYRCPQAAHVATSAEYRGIVGEGSADYLAVDEIRSSAQIADWMNWPEALSSCNVCAGSVGELVKHEQLRPRESEVMTATVDRDFLQILEQNPNASNSCVAREEVLWRGE
jgi:hypothetical protein